MELVNNTMRLCPETLNLLPRDIALPFYKREDLAIGIVHLGIGVFPRAHLAVATEKAIQATGDMRWGICGVSMRQTSTRDALLPQSWLYSVTDRSLGTNGNVRTNIRIVGVLKEVLVAPESPQMVLERIASSATKIISITVTEKGYCHNPTTGEPDFSHPAVVWDLGHPNNPCSIAGFIVYGLLLRQERNLGGLTIMSLDNIPHNGFLVRSLILGFASRINKDLAQWIEKNCTFPSSMVDRIVPATTTSDIDEMQKVLGVRDEWPVLCESFFDWAVEDAFVSGRPCWEQGGARIVADSSPYEKMKLRIVNAAHSLLSWSGLFLGYETVDSTVQDPLIRDYLKTVIKNEIIPTLDPVDICYEDYLGRVLERFGNPTLNHKLAKIVMDSSQKLPPRILEPIYDLLDKNMAIDGLCLGVALCINFMQHQLEQKPESHLDDPQAEAIKNEMMRTGLIFQNCFPGSEYESHSSAENTVALSEGIRKFLFYEPLFGSIGKKERFAITTTRLFLLIKLQGVEAAMKYYLELHV